MAKKTRLKNEETWQQIREEIIHVLLQNSDITNEDEIVAYFKKYYSEYHMDLTDLEIIIKDSRYINQLLKKNKSNKIKFSDRLKTKFNEILHNQMIELRNNSETDELDKEVFVGLQVLFEKVLDDEELMESLMNSDKSYQEVLNNLDVE